MASPIGIDLGTTNSVACVWQRGSIVTIPVDGRAVMPSAISVRPDGVVLVGQAAKARALLEPQQSILSAKRQMGDQSVQWQIADQTYRPIDVSRLVLNRLKQAAELYLGEPVTEAVITVPAYFNNNQKRDTKLAGESLGLRVLQLLPEPTAAAISYGLDMAKDQMLLVYDLGGGTFDVSILQVKGNQFQVLAVDGDFYLGGDDFDLKLVDYLIQSLQPRIQTPVDHLRRLFGSKLPSAPRELLIARQQLKEAAEAAKIELSESQTAQISIPSILGTSLDEEISLDLYNRLISPLVKQTISKIQAVLEAAKLTPEDIDRVLLVGGSTRNRLVREQVAVAVKEPFIPKQVDEAVAQGAAIVAIHLAAPEADLTPIEFQNVTPFSLGLRVSKDQDLDIFKVLIPKNSPIPAVVVEAFTTLRTNQKTVEIAIFQGGEANCSANTFVGGFRLAGIPAAAAGQPEIDVRFEMDSSDLLTVTATCNHLRQQQTLDVNLISRATELMPAVTADILFLIDTSGSMTAELASVKRSCLDFANRVIQAGLDCRLGLMDFDLPLVGKTYQWEIFPLMAPPQFSKAIAGLRIGRLGGYGCYVGEADTIPVVEAFVEAFSTEVPPGERLRIGILISDEVGNDAQTVSKLIALLQQQQICLYVVGVPRSCHEKLAQSTGGQFWNIHEYRSGIDFSSLLETIAIEITNLALR